jgi:hypothetical protein
MIPRPAIPRSLNHTPIFGKAMETPAKNRIGESRDCMLEGTPSGMKRDKRQSGIVRCMAARTARLGLIR